MEDLIQRISAAIARQEGMGDAALNPGNCRDCPWFTGSYQNRIYPEGGKVAFVKGFWVPRTRAEGVAGMRHVIALRIAMGQTLRQLITAWAPASDGNLTEQYIAHVQEWASIPNADQILWELLPPLVNLAQL